MTVRLKVFTWSDGFHAYTVAASSRAKALKAWGVSRDLFKDGFARELDAGPDYDRAIVEPGVVIERSERIDPDKLTALRPPPKAAKTSPALKQEEKPKGPDPEDVRRVARLKDEIAGLEKARAAKLADLDEEMRALESNRRDLERGFAQQHRELKRKLADAERRLR